MWRLPDHQHGREKQRKLFNLLLRLGTCGRLGLLEIAFYLPMKISERDSKPRSRPDIRWIGALVISLCLHIGLLTAYLSKSGFADSPSQSGKTSTPKSMTFRLITPVVDLAAGTAEETAATGLLKGPDQAETPDKERRPANSSSAVANPASAAEASETRFYTYEEVDQAALPVLDWDLPLQVITSSGLRSLVIKVWIAENGKVENAVLVSARPQMSLDDEEKIINDLMQTHMTPAIKNGKPVASQRVIEMVFEN